MNIIKILETLGSLSVPYSFSPSDISDIVRKRNKTPRHLELSINMKEEFTLKMKKICSKTVTSIADFYKKDGAIEAHVFGSIARGTNDSLSDIDIWITFEDDDIQNAIQNRLIAYSKFGEIVLMHEMQNNFPLNGIQTAIIYKIEDELIRVDFYLCPFSSSRIFPASKLLFEIKKVEEGSMIPETKRTPRDLSDHVTFFLSMCFNGIKKVVRNDFTFVDFLLGEFKKYEKEIPQLSTVPQELSFEMIQGCLQILEDVSNQEQKKAVHEIEQFIKKVKSFAL